MTTGDFRRMLGRIVLAGGIAVAGPSAAADWQATEVTRTYAVAGATGPELYASIGEKGPRIGVTRAIALTSYELKWSRKYVPEGSSCRLVSAKPFLTVTYTLPRPSGKLAGPVAENWKAFAEGIRIHEKVHGDLMRQMTQDILDTTVGLVVEDDPGCRKIKEQVKKPILNAGLAYKARTEAFERAEMAQGGNVHRLILALVNGR